MEMITAGSDRHGDDDLHGPAGPHPLPAAGVQSVHAPAHEAVEEDIRTLCAALLDDLVGRSSFDYVQDFGARVPAYVIAALLGVPSEDRDTVRGWIDESFHLDPETGMSNDMSAGAMSASWSISGRRWPTARRTHVTTCSPTW